MPLGKMALFKINHHPQAFEVECHFVLKLHGSVCKVIVDFAKQKGDNVSEVLSGGAGERLLGDWVVVAGFEEEIE